MSKLVEQDSEGRARQSLDRHKHGGHITSQSSPTPEYIRMPAFCVEENKDLTVLPRHGGPWENRRRMDLSNRYHVHEEMGEIIPRIFEYRRMNM